MSIFHAAFFLYLLLPAVVHAASDDLPQRIATSAEHYLAHKPRLASRTCSGLIVAILADAGVELGGSVSYMWGLLDEQGRTHHQPPGRVGDLVFFNNTYDGNHNGKVDDRKSHIAVVIQVDGDGTVHMVHHGSGAINPLTMNLAHPDVHTLGGKMINSFLAQPGYGPKDQRLAGQLWSGFASLGGDIPAVASAALPPPATPSLTDPGGAPTSPQGVASHPTNTTAARALARLHAGRRLHNRHLRGLDCESLWFLRNAVFARHGYAFITDKARDAFRQQLWYTRDPQVTRDTVAPLLTTNDRYNVSLIQAAEQRCE